MKIYYYLWYPLDIFVDDYDNYTNDDYDGVMNFFHRINWIKQKLLVQFSSAQLSSFRFNLHCTTFSCFKPAILAKLKRRRLTSPFCKWACTACGWNNRRDTQSFMYLIRAKNANKQNESLSALKRKPNECT